MMKAIWKIGLIVLAFAPLGRAQTPYAPTCLDSALTVNIQTFATSVSVALNLSSGTATDLANAALIRLDRQCAATALIPALQAQVSAQTAQLNNNTAALATLLTAPDGTLAAQLVSLQAQINSLKAQVAVLSGGNPPPPSCNPPNTIVNGVCAPPPPPTCAPPSTLVNGVCTPPTPPPPPGSKPVVSNGKVVVFVAAGADLSKCQGGAPQIVPDGTVGLVVNGPKTLLGITCWNVAFPSGMASGWTPESALSGQ